MAVISTGRRNTLSIMTKRWSVELREKMYQELWEIVSRYAELSERYFIQSEHPVFNLVVCGYQAESYEKPADIINITHFY